MDPNVFFQLTPPDAGRLRPQVRRALEKRTELLSRQRCPRLWALTDRLRRAEKEPPAPFRHRPKLRLALVLTDGALGLFLLLPGLMDPAALPVPLLVGAACFAFSLALLWGINRRLLGILSAALAVLLCLGALGNRAELGSFLPLGLLCGAVGAAALAPRRPNAFSRAAQQLLERAAEAAPASVRFSETGMVITRAEERAEPQVLPYADLELLLETEDLLLPVFQDGALLLQKKDLHGGTVPALMEFLSERAQCAAVRVRPRGGASTRSGRPGTRQGPCPRRRDML